MTSSMNDRSDRVDAHQSEQPGYEQNHRECVQHVLSLHVATAVLMTAALLVPVSASCAPYWLVLGHYWRFDEL